jgi:hypothetical protein
MKKSLNYGAKKQNKVLKSCGADFSIYSLDQVVLV